MAPVVTSTTVVGGVVSLSGRACSGENPVTNRTGVCVNSTVCSNVGGVGVPGLCPYDDPTVVTCCDNIGFQLTYTPSLYGNLCTGNHPSTGRPGACVSAATCTQAGGIAATSLCPYSAASPVCCDGPGFDIIFPTSPALCNDYASQQIFNLLGNSNVTYPVVKILPGDLTDSSLYSYLPTEKDNTMRADVACAFSALKNAALLSGVTLRITSGFRTYARQQYLWDCFTCLCCNGATPAASPGSSAYGDAQTLSLNIACSAQILGLPGCYDPAYEWLSSNGAAYGFINSDTTMPWQWQYRPTINLARGIQLAQYSAVGYCSEQQIYSWDCYQCKNNLQTFTPTFFFSGPNNGQGYLGYDDSREEIVIVIRGTITLLNFYADLEFLQVDLAFPKSVPGALVHSGFYDMAISLYQNFTSSFQALMAEKPGYHIVVTGHSLGGAVGCLISLMIYEDYGIQPEFQSFGEPRVGNLFFSEYWTSKINVMVHRFTHMQDPVPQLPPQFLNFHHHRTEIWFQDGTGLDYRVCDSSGEDPTCQDSVFLDLNILDHLYYLGVSDFVFFFLFFLSF